MPDRLHKDKAPAPRPAAHRCPFRDGPGIVSALELGKAAGNRAVAQVFQNDAVVQRRGVLDAIGDLLDIRTNEALLDCQEDQRDWQSRGFTPLTNHRPSTGIGQFDVTFDPLAWALTITLKVSYNFTAGDPTKVPAGFRPEEFNWTPAEQTDWKTRYQRDVGAQWSARHQFRSTRTEPCWPPIRVNTTVQVLEDAASPHFILSVAKYPPDAPMVQSSICPPGTRHDAASGNCVGHSGTHGTGDLDSNDMRPEQKLDWGNASVSVPFDRGAPRLGPAGQAALAPVITQLQGNPNSRVELTGRASTRHKAGADAAQGAIDNMDLARARATAVAGSITAAGIAADRVLTRNVGEQGAAETDDWCRVDAQVGTHQTQDPALHETGHMLGLDDEYPQTGAPAGTPLAPQYDAMIRAQTGDVVARGQNEGAMSMGSTVQRWHYSSFLEALKAITGETTWSI